MRGHDLLDHRQSESRPAHTRLCAAPVAVEDPWQVGRRDAGAVVSDPQHRVGAVPAHRDLDLVTGPAVPGAVGQQVADHLVEASGVGQHDDGDEVDGADPDPGGAQLGCPGRELLADDLRQVGAARFGGRHVVGSGKDAEVGDDPSQPEGLVVQAGQGGGIRLHQPVTQLLQPRLERGERGPQLMGDVRRHLATSLSGALHRVCRFVEAPCEVTQLTRAQVGRPDGVVPPRERPGDRRESGERAGEPPGHGPACEHRERERERSGDSDPGPGDVTTPLKGTRGHAGTTRALVGHLDRADRHAVHHDIRNRAGGAVHVLTARGTRLGDDGSGRVADDDARPRVAHEGERCAEVGGGPPVCSAVIDSR